MRGVLAVPAGGVRCGVHLAFAAMLVAAAVAGYPVHALILAASLVAHELAHLVAARLAGVAVEEVVLTPLGGVARLDPALALDPQAEVAIALAGPLQSLALAGVAHLLTGGLWDRDLVRFFYEVNTNLAYFNLLPALPLDGGRALRGLLAQRWGYRQVTRWMALAGRVTGAALTAWSAWAWSRGIHALTPLVAGPYLFWLAGQVPEDALYRSMQALLAKRGALARQRVVPARTLVAPADARLAEVLPHLAQRRYHLVLVLDPGLQPLGVLAEADLAAAFTALGPEVTLGQVLAWCRRPP